MDELLLYRALGVPDAIVLDDNRKRAAASKLGELIDEPLLTSDEYPVKIGFWLAHHGTLAEQGVFDGVLGGFEAAGDAAKRLGSQDTPARFGWELSFELSTALVQAVSEFVRAHPFKDEAGRYFA